MKEPTIEQVIAGLVRAAHGLRGRVGLADRAYALACEYGAQRLTDLLTLLPEAPLSASSKLRRAHELLADVAQARAGTPEAHELVILMAGIRAVDRTVSGEAVPEWT